MENRNYFDIFDTHTHYHDSAFSGETDEILQGLPQKGVCGLINCGTDVKTSWDSFHLAEKYSYVYFAAGIHGLDVKNAKPEDIAEIQTIAQLHKCVAIGEIGLDYHYESETKPIQLSYLEQQLRLARELDLPVIVHDREAHADTLALLQKYRPRGVMHCFSGSTEFLREVLKLGMYAGFGGAVTFKNAVKPVECVKEIPENRLLLETDCPYMTPVPFRGKRNSSELIPFLAQVIAEARGTQVQELLTQTKLNAMELFGIKTI